MLCKLALFTLQEQSYDIERVQRTALKVILGEEYEEYENALITCNLETLYSRREKRCLTFGLRSLKHPKHKQMFPFNKSDQSVRKPNAFKVNFARTSSYNKSADPYIQNMLNSHFRKKKEKILLNIVQILMLVNDVSDDLSQVH